VETFCRFVPIIATGQALAIIAGKGRTRNKPKDQKKEHNRKETNRKKQINKTQAEIPLLAFRCSSIETTVLHKCKTGFAVHHGR